MAERPAPSAALPAGAEDAALVEDLFDSGVICLVRLLRLFGMPGDPRQIRHQFARPGAPMGRDLLVRAAKRLGLKARAISTRWERLTKTPLPAIAETSDGEFILLAGAKDDVVLVQDPKAGSVETLDRETFERRWSGRLILVAKRARLLGEGSKFDISWFIPAILKYRRIFGEVLIASFFLQLAALATPLLFQVVIDKVLVHRGFTTLDVLVFALVAISVFEVALGGLRTYIFSHTTNRIDVELGAKLYRHLLGLPLAYFEARQVGESVARVRELENIRDFITGSSLTLVIDLLFTVVFFVVMWWFSPMLTMIVLGSIPLYVLLAVFVTPVLRARLEEKFQRGAVNQAFLVESVTGVETLKALAVEPQSQRKWEEQLAAYVHASFKTTHLGNIAGQLTQLINKVTIAATLYFGALAVIGGALSVGQLIAFNMLAGRVTGPILRLSQLWNDFQQARISIERLGDILNTQVEPQYNPNRATLSRIKGDIRFDGVGFRYQPHLKNVLTDVDLVIPAGQVVGVVGPSGSGKSTLTKLVQRMYAPTHGRVLIDGVDISTVDANWLRQQVGVVLQENLLFSQTIRENIALADPGLPLERVVAAARLAGAEEFIEELSEGYDTQVGERGSNLSGGQRQRIAVARALIGEPRILIFDEATSALDYESEQIIQRNMKAICRDRTVMIIAHRLSSVRHADRILTVDGGSIVEDGTHDELMKAGGRYARLWRIQAGGVTDAA